MSPVAGKSKQQVRLAVDLLSSAGNEVMADIRIVAKDGGILPASRFVLGARSPVLQKMLYAETSNTGSGSSPEGTAAGTTSSSASPQLRLDYSSGVVRALIYYCRSNEIEPCHSKDENCSRELVQLGDCASAFELDGLEDLVCETVTALMEAFPHLSPAVYDEAVVLGEAVERLKYVALRMIRRNPEATLMKRNEFQNREPGVSYLSRVAMEEILCDRRMCTEEVSMFRALALWADANPSVTDSSAGAGGSALHDKSATSRRDRKRLASNYVERYIDLSSIAPSDLFGIVSDSGLVGADKISGALVQLALRAEKEGVNLSKARATVNDSGGAGAPMPPKRPEQPQRNANNNNRQQPQSQQQQMSGGAHSRQKTNKTDYSMEDGGSVVSMGSHGSSGTPPPNNSKPPPRKKKSPQLSNNSKKKVDLADVIDYMVGDRLDGCCRYARNGESPTL